MRESYRKGEADLTPFWSQSLVLFLARATVEAVIKERQREGIELAKRKGLYTGRKLSLSPERVARLRTRVAAGESKSKLAKTA